MKRAAASALMLVLLALAGCPRQEAAEFGTTGQLYDSNLVMYDRKTDTRWTQIDGTATVGPSPATSSSPFRSTRSAGAPGRHDR